MTSVLVTGASGFIGRHILGALRHAGYEAIGAARRSVEPPCVELDLRGRLDRLPATDWVVHLAGGYAGADAATLQRDDGAMADNLVEWGIRAGVRNWIFASAAEVYGSSPEPVTEVAPTRPVIPYGAVKLDIERLFARAAGDGDLSRVVVLRIGEVYGRGGKLVAELTRRFRSGFCPWFGSGTVPVSFIHVEDVAATCIRAIEEAPERHSTWNVADDLPATWRAFLDDFAGMLGTRRAVGLPDPLPGLYAAVSSRWDRLRRRPPVVTRHIVTLLTTPKVMSNRKLRDDLGVRLAYPSHGEGLRQLLVEETNGNTA